MGKLIDVFVNLVVEIIFELSKCEMDMFLFMGEQVMILFLVMVFQEKGYDVVFYMGWQVGVCIEVVYGNVRIMDIDIMVIQVQFVEGRIIVVVGFQGVMEDGGIMMFGWGGFDIMVVVFVAVLGVDKCDIYIDVLGVFMIDLWYVWLVRKLVGIFYDEMLEFVNFGVGVFYLWVVEFVKNY